MALTKVTYAMIDSAPVSVLDYGADPSGVNDSRAAIQAALDSGATKVEFPNGTYLIKNYIYIRSDTVVDGCNSTILVDFTTVGGTNAILIEDEGASNIAVQNLNMDTVSSTNTRWAIAVYGEGKTVKPNNIFFNNIRTKGFAWGGINVNWGNNITIVGHHHDGGLRSIAIGGTLAGGVYTPAQLTDANYQITVTGCSSKNTTISGFQCYYSREIAVSNYVIDAAQITGGEVSGISFDRTENFSVTNCIVANGNALANCILVIGRNGVLSGNATEGGRAGIAVTYNFESAEDAAWQVSSNIVVTGNTVKGSTTDAILFNGVHYSTISGNVVYNAGGNSYVVIDQTRVSDGLPMTTEKITLVGNIGDTNYLQILTLTPATDRPSLIGNRFVGGYTNLTDYNIVLDADKRGNFSSAFATDDVFKISGLVSSGFARLLIESKDTAGSAAFFTVNGATAGSITHPTAASTNYNTSSDYRLKANIRPLTGALDRVMQYEPSEWEWLCDGSTGVGFVAHKIQEHRPQAVTGQKDAVDKDGKPVYQAMDNSVLVADLTAALQELKREFDAYKLTH